MTGDRRGFTKAGAGAPTPALKVGCDAPTGAAEFATAEACIARIAAS
jgi:hypothetical protein